MMSFCKRRLLSHLGINGDLRRRIQVIDPPEGGGLGLVLADDAPDLPHVVQSLAAAYDHRKASGGGVPAVEESSSLGLCTESLGSESCDGGIGSGAEEPVAEGSRKLSGKHKAVAAAPAPAGRLPPALPRLSGQGRGFLKAERTDGRLVLTEISVDPQPEALRAIRADGRLLLAMPPAKKEALSCI